MKTYLLKNIPDELWQKFKAKTTKDITIGAKILSLIEGFVKE